MTEYTRKPTTAKAWQYGKQAKAEWPQWVRDYEVATNMGLQPIGAGPGLLLIPQKTGATIQVTDGEWLVLEDDDEGKPGKIRVYKDENFRKHFDQPVRGADHNQITTTRSGTAEEVAAAQAAEALAENPPVVEAADLVVPVPGTPAGDVVADAVVADAVSGDPVIEPAPTSTPVAKPGKAGDKKST